MKTVVIGLGTMGSDINQAVTEALASGKSMELDTVKVVDVVAKDAAGNEFLNYLGLQLC